MQFIIFGTITRFSLSLSLLVYLVRQSSIAFIPIIIHLPSNTDCTMFSSGLRLRRPTTNLRFIWSGGFVYVQGFSRINSDLPTELREFGMASAGVADSLGILVADISALFIQVRPGSFFHLIVGKAISRVHC